MAGQSSCTVHIRPIHQMKVQMGAGGKTHVTDTPQHVPLTYVVSFLYGYAALNHVSIDGVFSVSML